MCPFFSNLYNNHVLRSSIPLGRFFGVDVRVHLSFPLLLLLSLMYATLLHQSSWRGLGLWLVLCLAVVIREAARSLAAVYSGLRVRAIFLLPVGGIMALAPMPGQPEPKSSSTRLVSAAGPFANFAVGLVLLAAAYAIDGHVSLLATPWISVQYILRSLIWSQFILGAVGLLPVSTLTSQRFFNSRRAKADDTPASQPGNARKDEEQAPSGLRVPTLNAGSFLALAMIIGGIVLPMHLWLVLCGAFLLLYSQITLAQPAATSTAAEILVRDVMLTEYTLLSTTDTLRSALDHTAHSLQDVFPVMRGNFLVGSVARATLINRLMVEGDGYLQGIMTRTLQFASPGEKLGEALRRAAALGASEFIPVIEDGAMLGILTPQSLGRAAQVASLLRSQQIAAEREQQ
ncbi:CBS domain-containing protein [Bryocella elongata]|uniref:CBS domain-containing protein n=1 Tax=Bryocella elongata TaxID=863522 RepID=A0A1H5WIM7_9BACT|nr:site-2 protease family protein [Bryocella elongata]SEF99479.1 CBS domain-containing protein [Bryocella elongata]